MHLTAEGLEAIRQIKAGMNTGIKFYQLIINRLVRVGKTDKSAITQIK